MGGIKSIVKHSLNCLEKMDVVSGSKKVKPV